MSYRILVVDDDRDNRASTKKFLETQKYRVDTAASGQEAITLFAGSEKPEYAVILMDYRMPEMNGTQAAKEILTRQPRQLIAIYSCDDSKELLINSIQSGVVDYLNKDIQPDEFLRKLEALCGKYEMTTRPILAAKDGEEITPDHELLAKAGLVGCSPGLVRVARDIQRFANEEQTVMISGETGTGKELVARALHRMSARANNPFIALNCTAIPENLLESTLFGHEKGSFTGAVKSQVGKFVLANRGTLFLDEIGDLPPNLQVKLLRVLQEKQVEAVGSNRAVSIDVRIVVATHRNLIEMVKAGQFREDLYYRLNVLSTVIPPLRDRTEDVEPLIAHFTANYCKTKGIKKRFERGTLPILKSYPWPGNVRELEHMVERHLIQCDGGTVRVEDLDSRLFQGNKSVASSGAISGGTSLKDFEAKQRAEFKLFVRGILTRSESKSDAARKMQVSPSKLHYYLEAYGIGS